MSEEAKQPQQIQIDPIAMLNEARAENDFRAMQSLRNANDVLTLIRQRDELKKALEDQAKEFELEKTRIEQERDQMMQRLEAANAKIIEIQAEQSPKRKVKSDG